MTNTQRVMKHPRYVRHYRAGKKCVVLIANDSPYWISKTAVHGHTWTEAFRKAALHLVTQRVTQ